MTAPTPEEIEAAALSMFEEFGGGNWTFETESTRNMWRANAVVVLEAAAPFIAAQAKGEALRELASQRVLASEWWHERTDINFAGRIRTWLDQRADEIEGEKS